jgi:hypothetical protein
MDLPGYDEWKLMSPEDERTDKVCFYCEGEPEAGWIEMPNNGPIVACPICTERDPDTWREEREEAKRDRENDR